MLPITNYRYIDHISLNWRGKYHCLSFLSSLSNSLSEKNKNFLMPFLYESHRKRATPADKNILGVIPGSMTDPDYVDKGIDNTGSFCSATHGAAC